MMWMVRHRWAVAVSFTMNLLRHQVQMVVREPGRDPQIIQAFEGSIQRYTLEMFLYAIGLLSLAEKLWGEINDVAFPFSLMT